MKAEEGKPEPNDAVSEMTQLREEHEYFQLLTENVRDYAIFKLDPEGRVATWNSGAQRMKGFPATEIIGQPLSCFYTAEEISQGQPARQLIIARDQGYWAGEGWRVRKDGSRFWAEVTITALRNGAGELLGFAKITRDTTERKQAQTALTQSQQAETARRQELEQLMEAVPVAVLVAQDPACQKITGNRAGYDLLRVPRGANVSRTAPSTERPENYEAFHDGHPIPGDELPMQKAARTNQPVLGSELELRFSDGTSRWTLGNAVPLQNPDGTARGALGVFLDITEHKRTEEALRESEAQLRAILDQAPCGITIRALPSGTMLLRNEQANRILGRTIPGLDDVQSYRGVHPDGRAYEREDYAIIRAAEKGEVVRGEEFTFHRPDGTPFTLNVSAAPIHDAHGKVIAVVTVFDDITDLKRTEAALRESEKRLAAELADMKRLHKVTTYFIRHGDLRTVLNAILDAATAITGADKGNVQLLDPASGELRIEVHRGYDPAFVEYFSHIRLGTVACGTAAQTRQAVIIEDITVHPLILAEQRALELMLAAGVRSLVCTPLVAGSGRVIGVLSTHFAAPHRPSGRDLRLLELLASQAADYAERTEAEEALRAAREALKQANTNLERNVQERTLRLQDLVDELEHFSYTITHDMRAPLRAIQGFASLIKQDCGDTLNSQGMEYLNLIKTSAARMDMLITDALQYNKAGKQAMPVGPVDAAALLLSIIESYPSFQPPHARIRIEGSIPMVLGSEAGLTQCFSNLLGNAVKFVQPGKVPEVRVSGESREGFVRLWFEDNGIGIPVEAQNKLFQMFHRATDKFEGTGIGLALAKKVTERMGGRIGVESTAGQGSRFWVDLQPANEPGFKNNSDSICSV